MLAGAAARVGLEGALHGRVLRSVAPRGSRGSMWCSSRWPGGAGTAVPRSRIMSTTSDGTGAACSGATAGRTGSGTTSQPVASVPSAVLRSPRIACTDRTPRSTSPLAGPAPRAHRSIRDPSAVLRVSAAWPVTVLSMGWGSRAAQSMPVPRGSCKVVRGWECRCTVRRHDRVRPRPGVLRGKM